MSALADAAGCSTVFVGFLIQGVFIYFIVIFLKKRLGSRSTPIGTDGISSIAKQWPTDEKYLSKLCRPILAVPFKEGDYTCYATSIQGRKVSLRYFHDTNPKVLKITFAVTQKFWLRIVPQKGERVPEEIRMKDELLDAKYRIHSDQQQIAFRFLNSPKVVKELWGLHEFNSFEINKGSATFELNNPRDSGFLHYAFEKTFNHLNAILDIYEKQKFDLYVEILQTESSICPYCREDLDASKEVIVKCNMCRTAHHESCFRENKQCTTWGCLAAENDFTVMNGNRAAQEFETN